jgi:hypothetical protein
MPRQYTETVYQFDELSDDAKETAREWFRGCDSPDLDSVVTDFCEILGHLGFTVESKDVEWSGFCSQGDGASFTGLFNLADMKPEALKAWGSGETVNVCLQDVAAFKPDASRFYREVLRCLPLSHWAEWRALFRETRSETRVSIERYSSRYSHHMTMQAGDSGEWCEAVAYFMGDTEYDDSGVESACDNFTDDVRDFARNLAQSLYSALEREYEYQTSDDSADENIQINEYEFTENGERA